MRLNKKMNTLLRELGIDIDNISPEYDYPIWQKFDQAGRPYWGVSHFWNIDKRGVSGEQDLSQLDWDGNEMNLDAKSKAEIPKIFEKMIGIIKAWKEKLENNYPNTQLYIFASYDNGDELEDNEDFPDGWYSLTFRFYSPRGGNTVVNLESFDEWEQPALMAVCNK